MTNQAPSPAEIERELTSKGKLGPRITIEQIDQTIVREEFWTPEGTTLTVCVLVLVNGFCVVGTSAAAVYTNFDKSMGERLARGDAWGKIWQLEGYLLRDKLYRAEQAQLNAEQLNAEMPRVVRPEDNGQQDPQQDPQQDKLL
jgi:hypothetical protein